jgi:hypothetical protein
MLELRCLVRTVTAPASARIRVSSCPTEVQIQNSLTTVCAQLYQYGAWDANNQPQFGHTRSAHRTSEKRLESAWDSFYPQMLHVLRFT